MAGSGASREKRVAERIRSDLSAMLVRGAIRDPDVQGAIVSDVQITNDLSVARVFMRLLEGDVDPPRRKRLIDAMKRANGYIRREIGQTLVLRRVPELRFEWDDATDRASRLEELLQEVRTETRDPGGKEPR